jgi:DNA-binding MltR family transcriptional regulator
MAKSNKTPPSFDAFFAMFPELKGESDRGLVLILTAWIDDSLGEFLRTRLIKDDAVTDRLFAFDKPLGTFSSRIAMAYAIGFISKSLYADLNQFREIRNAFAHFREPISFETQQIRDRCGAIQLIADYNAGAPGDQRLTDPKVIFFQAATSIGGYLLSWITDPEGTRSFSGYREEHLLRQTTKQSLDNIFAKLRNP